MAAAAAAVAIDDPVRFAAGFETHLSAEAVSGRHRYGIRFGNSQSWCSMSAPRLLAGHAGT